MSEYIRNKNGLSRAEQERLVLLIKKASAISAAASNILQDGYEVEVDEISHRKALAKVTGEIFLAAQLLIESNDISEKEIDNAFDSEAIILEKELHYNLIPEWLKQGAEHE